MKKILKFFGIACGVLLVLMVAAVVLVPTKPGASGAAKAAPIKPEPAAALLPSMPVTASMLSSDYDDNEVAADQKYKGKRLAVSGTVQSINKDAFDNIVINLKTRNEFMPVRASFEDKHEELAASLKKGSKVTWDCDGGGQILGSPILRKCAPANRSG